MREAGGKTHSALHYVGIETPSTVTEHQSNRVLRSDDLTVDSVDGVDPTPAAAARFLVTDRH